MLHRATTTIGKTVQKVASARGGGSALPGLVIEKLNPHFLPTALRSLPYGVVMVMGTNGKTTTTKVVTELLESTGLKVFSNPTGSNFTRGVTSAVLRASNKSGHLPHDIAVLELDEAHATHFIKSIQPDYVLCLNVMRDQLDRFGEIDYTASLIETVAKTAKKTVVLNRDDHRIARIAQTLAPNIGVEYFSRAEQLHSLFVSDDELHYVQPTAPSPENTSKDSVVLTQVDGQTASFAIGGSLYSKTLQLTGAYNFLNAAAALALVRIIKPDAAIPALLVALSAIRPAFGRGEKVLVEGDEVEIVLVKNPAGFRLALNSFNAHGTQTMIAINDQYADSRDVSWLWDVTFDSLQESGVAMVSGIRAYDMALRLHYDDVTVQAVEPDLAAALRTFLQTTKGSPKRIYCTYTFMLQLRKQLAKITNVERVK